MGAIGLTVVSVNSNPVAPTLFGFDIDEIAQPISNDGTFSLIIVRTYSKLNSTSSYIETRYEVQENLATIVAMSDELFLGDVIYYRGRTTEYAVSYQRIFPLQKIKTIFNPEVSGTQFNFYENQNLLPVFYEVTQSILQIISQLSPSDTFWALDGNTVGAIKTLGTKDNYDLPIITNNSEVARFKNNGNVGIGVPPSYRLDVSTVGAVTTAITRFANITNSFKVFASNTTPESNIIGDRGDLCIVNDGSTGELYIKYTGIGNNTGWVNFFSQGGLKHATATGTDTYTATILGVTSYSDGDSYLIRFTNGNTVAGPTLNINGVGAITLYRNNDGQLLSGDILDGGEMLCVYNSTLNVFQCIGTSPNSIFAYVTNGEAIAITKGQPVYAYSGVGDRMVVKLAYNTSDATSARTVGMVYSTSIAAGQKGFIMTEGLLDGLSNVKPINGWNDGDQVYLGATAGTITNIKPYAPNHMVYVGIVTTASPGSAGRVYVKCQNGYELDEIHNCDLVSVPPVNNDVLTYITGPNNLWKPRSIASILGYTPVPNSRQITINGTTYDLTIDRSWSVGTVTSVGITAGTGISLSGTNPVTSSGNITVTNSAPDQTVSLTQGGTTTITGTYPNFTISSADQYNGTVTSVAALTLGTSGTDLSSTVATGTTTPVITLNVPTASATNRGALSSTDWSTFNNKQDAITLTTTGTSGAATLIGSTLNIPQYSGSGVTSVTGTSPISSSGGTTPNISISQATTSTNGYLSSTDWNTFNGKLSNYNYVVPFFINGFNPADSTTYYCTRIAPTTTATTHQIKLGLNGTIVAAILLAHSNTTAGSTESATLNFRNITTATSSLISNAFKTNGSATVQQTVTVNSLSISFLATDNVCLEFVAPLYATNPQGLNISVYLYIKG